MSWDKAGPLAWIAAHAAEVRAALGISSGGTLATHRALGTGDGSTRAFDFGQVATIVGAAVFVDGLAQDPSLWSISAGGGAGGVDRLAFSSGNAPANGAKVEVLAFTRS